MPLSLNAGVEWGDEQCPLLDRMSICSSYQEHKEFSRDTPPCQKTCAKTFWFTLFTHDRLKKISVNSEITINRFIVKKTGNTFCNTM
jgi:hypothetical protein